MLKPNEHERSEQELKALFQTMRRADAERAPSFAQTSFAASLRTVPLPQRERLGYLRRYLRTDLRTVMGAVAAVAAVILLVMGVNAWWRGGNESPVAPRPLVTAGGPAAATKLVGARESSGGGTPPLQPAGRRRYQAAPKLGHQQTPVQQAPVPSISTWKSPTDALLKFPGEGVMSDVPKLGFTPAGGGKTAE